MSYCSPLPSHRLGSFTKAIPGDKNPEQFLPLEQKMGYSPWTGLCTCPRSHQLLRSHAQHDPTRSRSLAAATSSDSSKRRAAQFRVTRCGLGAPGVFYTSGTPLDIRSSVSSHTCLPLADAAQALICQLSLHGTQSDCRVLLHVTRGQRYSCYSHLAFMESMLVFVDTS